MEKFYYVWVSLIKGLNNNTFIKLICKLEYSVKKLYNLTMNYDNFILYLKSNNIFISKNIFMQLVSFNLKEKSKIFYQFILNNDVNMITYRSKEFSIISQSNIPVIYSLGNLSVLEKIKYYVYSEKNSRKILKIENIIKNHILEEKNVLIEKYNSVLNDRNCIYIGDYKDLINSIEFISQKNLYLFCINNINELISTVLDKFIIVNAKYNKKVVSMVDISLDIGKEILVFPNNILDKNAYFSNLLIKDGADVILGIEDL